MQIKDLTPKSKFDFLELTIIEKSNSREFEKFGKKLTVCTAIGKDESGQVKISLWNAEIDIVNVDDTIKFTDGWCDSYKDELQISLGKNGKIEKSKHVKITPQKEFKEIPEFEEPFTDEFIEELDRPLY